MTTRAEIIAIGSELLTPSRTDTNSLYITEKLNEIGIDVRAKVIAGDDRDELAAILRVALDRADLVITTGGLGPTEDDLTLDTVAGVLSLPLEEDRSILEGIEARFASRGFRMPDINRRQARVPRGAVVLPNANGTAPGVWIERPRRVLLLPGPPGEMRPMIDRWCQTAGVGLAGGTVLVRRVLRIANRPESHVDEIAQPIYSKWRDGEPPITTTILAAPGQIELHLTARAPSRAAADAALSAATDELVEALAPDVFSTDGRSMEAVVGDLLRQHGRTIALAESCTGGLVASRLTDVAGSSDYLVGGVVAYSNAVKTALLDVPEPMIAEYGAVSEPVAAAMADGARERTAASIGVGITGIAGPTGGSPAKPVGTVAIAVSSPAGTRVRTYHLRGSRGQIKFQASQAALDMVRRMLLET